MSRRALVETDQLVDLVAGEPAAPADQRLEPLPLTAVRRDVRVDIHAAQTNLPARTHPAVERPSGGGVA